MKTLLVVLVLALLGVAGTSSAQSVDFVHQDVFVDVTATPLHVEVTLRVAATGRADSLAILNPSMDLTSLEVSGEAVGLTPDETYPDFVSWASWPEALADGDEAEMRMVLDGEPRCTSPFVQGAVCALDDDETMLMPSSGAMSWTFVNLFETDPFTSTVTVRAPEGHEVAAGQGAPRSVTDGEDGTRTWTFGADVPTEQIAVYTRAAARVRVEGEIPVVGIAEDEGDALVILEELATTAAQVAPVHQERYGDAGLDELHLLTFSSRTAFGGMGLYGNVWLFEEILTDDFEYLRVQGIAHETAHTWFGGRASAGDYAEGPFFNEAFAEYAAWVALGELYGDDVRTSGVRMSAVWYMLRRPSDDDIAVLDPDVADSPLYVWVTYHKASVFLRTLEERAGAEAFGRALAALVARGPGGMSVEALVEEILAESGWDASDTIDEWLYAPGFPTIEAGLHEDGALAVDVAGPYPMRLPVTIDRTDGTSETLTLDVTEGPQALPLPAGAAPIRVAIDPRWTLSRLVRPRLPGDVSLDGVVDAIDLVEVARRQGGTLPTERRIDGAYDPLFDVDADERIDRDDLEAIAD